MLQITFAIGALLAVYSLVVVAAVLRFRMERRSKLRKFRDSRTKFQSDQAQEKQRSSTKLLPSIEEMNMN